jgi:hypothetical protein
MPEPATGFSFLKIDNIAEQSRKVKCRIKAIAAGGNPRYRLYMHGVNCKEECNDGSDLQSPGQSLKQVKNQHDADQVDQQVGGMVRSRIVLPCLIVQRQGENGNRLIHSQVIGREEFLHIHIPDALILNIFPVIPTIEYLIADIA